MIDNLVTLLKKEQVDDDAKKDYCLAEIDKAEETKKELELDISDLHKAIADGERSTNTLTRDRCALWYGGSHRCYQGTRYGSRRTDGAAQGGA